MSIQETDRPQRLGGDAPVRFSARPSDGSEPAGRRGAGLSGVTRSAELLVLVAGIAAVLIAAAVDGGFGAERAWTLVTVLAAAYIVRRR